LFTTHQRKLSKELLIDVASDELHKLECLNLATKSYSRDCGLKKSARDWWGMLESKFLLSRRSAASSHCASRECKSLWDEILGPLWAWSLPKSTCAGGGTYSKIKRPQEGEGEEKKEKGGAVIPKVAKFRSIAIKIFMPSV